MRRGYLTLLLIAIAIVACWDSPSAKDSPSDTEKTTSDTTKIACDVNSIVVDQHNRTITLVPNSFVSIQVKKVDTSLAGLTIKGRFVVSGAKWDCRAYPRGDDTNTCDLHMPSTAGKTYIFRAEELTWKWNSTSANDSLTRFAFVAPQKLDVHHRHMATLGTFIISYGCTPDGFRGEILPDYVNDEMWP